MHLPDVSSRAVTAGLVALALLDVFLVGTALRSTQISSAGSSSAGSSSAGSSSAGSSSAGSVSASIASTGASVSPSARAKVATSTVAAAPLETILVALDNQRAWRASAGSCAAGGASVATTADGGRIWVKGRAPLRTIVRVQPADGRAAFVVGADSGCSAKLSETSDGGGTWGANSVVEGAWFRDPKDPRTVGAPGPATSQPCGKRAVLDLAALATSSARVLCSDGLIRSSTDAGSSWTGSSKVAGAVALAVLRGDPRQTYVARLQAPDCAGVQILRVGKRVPTSCIRSALPKKPGQIAMSLVKGGGWLAVGDTTMRSTDDLITWRVS